MTEQPLQPDRTPAPGALTGASSAIPAAPAGTGTAPATAGSLSDRAARLEAELAAVRAEAVAGAKAMLRVLAPHSLFTHGGITVGTDPTAVPDRSVGPLLTAAAAAGVKIEEVS